MLRRVLRPSLAQNACLPQRSYATFANELSSTPCSSAPLYRPISIPALATSRNRLSETRAYATAAATDPVPRTRAKKTLGTPKKTTSDKTTTKKIPAKKKPKAAAKPKKKPKAAAKPKKKKKKPVARKPRVKKPLSPNDAMVAKVKALKQVALLEEPKKIPDTAWLIFNAENFPKGSATIGTGAAEVAAKYKDLSTSEREHLDNVARQNKTNNEKALQSWIETHTPDAIRLANTARRQLNRIAEGPIAEGRKTHYCRKVTLIKDPRAVKRVLTPFIVWVRSRWASGDFKDTKPIEVMKILGEEWKLVSHEEKDSLKAEYSKNREQYQKDYDAIFTKGVKSPPRTPVAAAA